MEEGIYHERQARERRGLIVYFLGITDRSARNARTTLHLKCPKYADVRSKLHLTIQPY